MTERFDVPQAPPLGSTGSITTSVPATSGDSIGQSTKDTAKEHARGVAQEGAQGGKHVASVATDQAKEVVSEAGTQAHALLTEARTELMAQAASQKDRVADQLHTLAQEFGSMARSSDQDGLAADLAEQASRQVGTIAHWVSEREPGSLVGELKDFARAKPGTFLAIAAGIGLVAGRMTRGAKAGPPDNLSASIPPVQPGIPAVDSPGGTSAVGSVQGVGDAPSDLIPASPEVGGPYTDATIHAAFTSRTPGLPR